MVSKNRYSLYIGRFQPFHKGHKWCVQQMIGEGKKVCIAVMDIHELEPKNNPYTYEEVLNRIFETMDDEIKSGKVKVIKINTAIIRGKLKSFKGSLGFKKDIKKAIVTLADGNTIDSSLEIK